MEEIKTNNNIETQENKPDVNEIESNNENKSWRDIVITPEMPLSLIVDFLNILNFRIADIEDFIAKQTTINQ